MAGTGDKLGSLRPGRMEGGRVVLALAISLCVHMLIWAGYELNRDFHWISRAPLSRMKQAQVRRYEQPLEFVMVETPSTPAPKAPKYISNKNSQAADQSKSRNSDRPKLNGRQTDAPKTEDEIRAQIAAARAAAAELRQPSQSSEQARAQPGPAQSEGDLTLGKPDNAAQPKEQPRPRTLREAYREMAARFPGMTMREDGGAERKAARASFAVKLTGFGDYDARFVETVSHNWWNLLGSRQFASDRTGKVTLLFRLNYDGTISQLRFGDNSVGDLLGYVCEKALLDGEPYERWTEDMRLKLGDSVNVQFTFVYE